MEPLSSPSAPVTGSLRAPVSVFPLAAVVTVVVLLGLYIVCVVFDLEFLYFNIILGLVVFATALVQFEAAFLFVPLAVTNPYVLTDIGVNLIVSEYILLIIFFAWFVRLIPARKQLVFPRAFALPIVLLVVTGALSIASARYPMSTLMQVIRYVEILVLLFLIVINECREEKQIRSMVFFLLIGGFGASLVGIGQFIFFAQTMGELHRVSGLHGGAYGGVVGSTIFLALGVLLFERSRARKTFALVVLGCAITAIILSQTRAWIGGVALGLAVVVFLGRARSLRPILLLAGAGVVVVVLLTQTNVFGVSASGMLRGAATKAFRYGAPSKSITVGDLALYERMVVWSRGVSLTLQNPVFGIGAGNLRFDDYLHAHLTAPSPRAGFVDNQYLDFFAEAGVVAGAAWILFLWVALATGLTGLRNSHGTSLQAEAYGLFPSLIVFVVGSFFWVITAHHDVFAEFVLEIALMVNVTRALMEKKNAGNAAK